MGEETYLLDGVLLGLGEAGNVVNVGDGLEGGLGGADLACDGGVHPRDLDVHTHVGVVEVNLLLAAEVLDAVVVDLGAGAEAAEEKRGTDKAGGRGLGEVLREAMKS